MAKEGSLSNASHVLRAGGFSKTKVPKLCPRAKLKGFNSI